MTSDGLLKKTDGGWAVECMSSSVAKIPGVTCLNPEAGDSERIYRKEFTNRKIFGHDELDAARATLGLNENSIVLGMTGYSSIKPEECAAWGITPGAYEKACEDILATTIKTLRDRYAGIHIAVVHGSSVLRYPNGVKMGIDSAVINVARTLGVPQLGFSCPAYMPYVEDDCSDPIYVARTKGAYSEEFIKSLHILFGCNGRQQALRNDLLAAIEFDKKYIPTNVLRAISRNGGPPARGANGKIEDATAAFESAIFRLSLTGRFGPDIWTNLRGEAANAVVELARYYLSPSMAFGEWRPDSMR